MDIVDFVLSEDRPQQVTFRTAYEPRILKAFTIGHELAFKYQGAMHVMKISSMVRLDETEMEITAVYDHTPPPMAEFRVAAPPVEEPRPHLPRQHEFNERPGEVDSPNAICRVCRQVRRVAASVCPGPALNG